MDRAQTQWGPQDLYPPPQQQPTPQGTASPPQQALGPTPVPPLGVEADTVPPRDQVSVSTNLYFLLFQLPNFSF